MAPKPLYNDRKARHHEIAATPRITQAEKCAHTAAKRKATQDGKKRKAQLAVVEEPESEDNDNEDSDQDGETNDVAPALEIAEGTGA